MNNNNQSSGFFYKFIIPAFFVICVFYACNNPTTETVTSEPPFVKDTSIIKRAEWLLGKWTGGSDVRTEESWERLDDSTYIGKGLFIKGNDTLSKESLRIERRGGELFYIPVVINQNDGLPVIFKLTVSNENELVFENPTHDFPQKIKYKKIGNDSMVAGIYGLLVSKQRSEEFAMKRVK